MRTHMHRCAVGFCFFVPTCGIALCISLYMTGKAGKIVHVTAPDGTAKTVTFSEP